eukprot:438761-Prymnesium_polylepis.1
MNDKRWPTRYLYTCTRGRPKRGKSNPLIFPIISSKRFMGRARRHIPGGGQLLRPAPQHDKLEREQCDSQRGRVQSNAHKARSTDYKFVCRFAWIGRQHPSSSTSPGPSITPPPGVHTPARRWFCHGCIYATAATGRARSGAVEQVEQEGKIVLVGVAHGREVVVAQPHALVQRAQGSLIAGGRVVQSATVVAE